MEKEEQELELLIPLNKDALEKYTRRLENPWSLIGLFYRIKRRLRAALEPLWVTIPEYNRYSMGWRMGGGEDVSTRFQRRYRNLSENSKEAFRRQYPEPEGWEGKQ